MVIWRRTVSSDGCKDITSLRCQHCEFWMGLGDTYQQDLNPMKVLAGAKGSSPKKVKVKELGEKQALTMRSRKTSTSVPWMWHQVVLEWVRI